MITRAFAIATVSVWLAALWFAVGYLRHDPRRGQLWLFLVVTMIGNVGVVFASDVITFYALYSVMTFGAYGMIVHERTPDADRAGRVYIMMSVLGELALLAAMVLIVGTRANLPIADVPAAVARSPYRSVIVSLLLLGFGIKVGAVPLHLWLPLAHPVAPTPASAVLSGSMIKAGLLGWLRFLPLGAIAMPTHGRICVIAGFVAVMGGALAGATQRDPKTALAYSSVSQMGFATVAIGVALSEPASFLAVTEALAVFVVHHAFAKSALFLGVSVVATSRRGTTRRTLVTVGMVFAALTVAGAPITSGAHAKLALHDVATMAAVPGVLEWLLSIAAIGSTLVIARVIELALARGQSREGSGALLPWIALVGTPWLLLVAPNVASLLAPAHVWSATWPIVAGLGLAWSLRARVRVVIPAGDLLHVLKRLSHGLLSLIARVAPAMHDARDRIVAARSALVAAGDRRLAWTNRAEESLSTFGAIGALAVLVVAALVASILAH